MCLPFFGAILIIIKIFVYYLPVFIRINLYLIKLSNNGSVINNLVRTSFVKESSLMIILKEN